MPQILPAVRVQFGGAVRAARPVRQGADRRRHHQHRKEREHRGAHGGVAGGEVQHQHSGHRDHHDQRQQPRYRVRGQLAGHRRGRPDDERTVRRCRRGPRGSSRELHRSYDAATAHAVPGGGRMAVDEQNCRAETPAVRVSVPGTGFAGGGHVSDSVRRVSVQIDTLVDMLIGTDRGGTVIDVTLPSGVEVAELIPAIVDLAVGADGVDAESPTAWKLARVGGTVLDASRTLTENGIREGELLMLTGAASAPVTRAEAPPGLEPAAGRWHGARTALALWCPIAGTAAVVWTGLMRDDIGRTVPAAMLTVGAVAAVLPYRHRRDPLTATASALIVVMLAAVLGLLVVPDGPGPPNLMLAAAAAAAAAMVMARLTGVDIVGLTAVATGAAAVAISLIPAVLWPVPTVVIGVLTASLSMAVLAVAPRLSIALAGLTPAPDGGPDAPGSLFDDAPAAPRLVRGNAILTGILTG